jgi:hypothetical protein
VNQGWLGVFVEAGAEVRMALVSVLWPSQGYPQVDLCGAWGAWEDVLLQDLSYLLYMELEAVVVFCFRCALLLHALPVGIVIVPIQRTIGSHHGLRFLATRRFRLRDRISWAEDQRKTDP